jgi:FlaA1/EpsC-like NDP-sugar epimerase
VALFAVKMSKGPTLSETLAQMQETIDELRSQIVQNGATAWIKIISFTPKGATCTASRNAQIATMWQTLVSIPLHIIIQETMIPRLMYIFVHTNAPMRLFLGAIMMAHLSVPIARTTWRAFASLQTGIGPTMATTRPLIIAAAKRATLPVC